MNLKPLFARFGFLKGGSNVELPVGGRFGGLGAIEDILRLVKLGGTNINWAEEARPIFNNPIAAICLGRLCSMIGEATLELRMWNEKNERWEVVRGPRSVAALRPINRPNEYTTGKQMFQFWTVCWGITGEVYSFKRINPNGEIIGFTPFKFLSVSPSDTLDNTDGTKLITHFEYMSPKGDSLQIEKDDVLFIRNGIHPTDQKRGWSPVLETTREIVLYNDTATRQGALVRNPALGTIFSPAPQTQNNSTAGTPKQVEDAVSIIQELVRDKTGDSAMIPIPIITNQLGMNPKDIEMKGISQTAVDIICPAFGGDPMAFGLPSNSKTYNNIAEATDALGKGTVLPMLESFAAALTETVLPTLRFDTTLYRYEFNTDKVTWLMDDTADEQALHRENFMVGGMTLASFKEKIGEKPDKGDETQNYFTLQQGAIPTDQATVKPNGKAANSETDGRSEYVRNLTKIDDQLRAERNRPRDAAALDAVTIKKNTLQGQHDKVINKYRKRLTDLVSRRLDGLDDTEFRDAYSTELLGLHKELYTLGYKLAGSDVDKKEAELMARSIVDAEQHFLAGLSIDIENGLYVGKDGKPALTPALSNRIDLYAYKGSATASRGFLDGSPEEDEFAWKMTGIEHCYDCPYLAGGSPYLKETLYTVPRNGDTQCLGNCKCKLVRISDGQEGFSPL